MVLNCGIRHLTYCSLQFPVTFRCSRKRFVHTKLDIYVIIVTILQSNNKELKGKYKSADIPS